MSAKGMGVLRKFLKSYLIFFVICAFMITCCTMLFVTVFADEVGISLDSNGVSLAAKLTFLNVVLLSFAFSLIDLLRRRWTVDRPVSRIIAAAERIMAGDFQVRIKPVSRFGSDGKFNEVIACFNKLTEELLGVETLRSDFIANVSHEMKTPLAVMQNYGALLLTPDLEEEKHMEYARAVVDGCKRLVDMMTNILKLNRLENQQFYPQRHTFDLGEQLCECLLRFEDVWEKKGIAIDTDIAEGVHVKEDAELLTLVWNNLLSNAFKFTKTGGTVCVSMHAAGNCAEVKIKDTGCGMSARVGTHIFEKFYQGDTSRATEGNGLGLALVKRVIDILHGEIEVESEEGVGTTFTVRICTGTQGTLGNTEKTEDAYAGE